MTASVNCVIHYMACQEDFLNPVAFVHHRPRAEKDLQIPHDQETVKNEALAICIE